MNKSSDHRWLTAVVGGITCATGVQGTDVLLWDNGPWNGVNGYSNATSGVFGFRRTLLDDFVIDCPSKLQGFRWTSVWGTPLGGGGRHRSQLSIRSDIAGTPGLEIALANVESYEETDVTPQLLFSREFVSHWATFDPIALEPGHYWFEATVVGPENNFWLTADQQLNECWVNYEDLGGLQPGTEQFGVASDINFRLFGAVTGDSDCDGNVDFLDVLAVIAGWGLCPSKGTCPGDVEEDGDVDIQDLVLVLANWTGG